MVLGADEGAYHLHAMYPKTPSISSRIPEAMSGPKELLNILPQARTAVRKPSSLRLHHFERRNKAPCHSVRTRTKNWPVLTHWENTHLQIPRRSVIKSWVTPVRIEMSPQRAMQTERYVEGFPI
jgi:hypothetical protein